MEVVGGRRATPLYTDAQVTALVDAPPPEAAAVDGNVVAAAELGALAAVAAAAPAAAGDEEVLAAAEQVRQCCLGGCLRSKQALVTCQRTLTHCFCVEQAR